MNSFLKTNRLVYKSPEKMEKQIDPSSGSSEKMEKRKSTLPELGPAELEAVNTSDKPTLIVLSATWCKGCAKAIKALENLEKEVGNDVNIFIHTQDLHENNSASLYEKMGIDHPKTLPMLLFKNPKEAEFSSHINIPENIEGLSLFLDEKAGIKTKSLDLAQKEKSEEEYKKMVDEDPETFMKEFKIIADEQFAEDLLFMVGHNIEKNGPFLLLMFHEQYQNKPYTKRILEVAAWNSSNTDFQGALEFFRFYKNEQFAEEVLENAFRNASKSDKEVFVVWYFKLLKEREYSNELLESIAQDAESAKKIFEKYKFFLAKGYGDVEDLKVFAEYVRKTHPEIAEEYKDLLI
jgi:thiol-disulfide isomerase/thioredoxin